MKSLKSDNKINMERGIIEKIDEFSVAFPELIAIETEDKKINYGQLKAYSTQIAKEIELMTLSNEFVAIEGLKELETIVAMVAVLRAQRPFIVIDPRDSDISNSVKIDRLKINVYLSNSYDVDLVHIGPPPKKWINSAKYFYSPNKKLINVDKILGYAIYTSGTTGEPKCVIVPIEPLHYVIRDHVKKLNMNTTCKTLQFARLTFDGCLTEIFWTLTAGACLVVVNENSLIPGEILQATLQKYKITHLKTTPFALTVTTPTKKMCLEHVINGGGNCRLAMIEKWSKFAFFHNAYGTTETTVCNFLTDTLTINNCKKGIPLGKTVGSCGYKIKSNAEINNSSNKRFKGELIITGNSVALGYLTLDKLVKFQGESGEKSYATGDIVELFNSQIYFMERNDRQVKVRGFRIDPGEVENAICKIQNVIESVVLKEEHLHKSSERLICFYMGTIEPRELRTKLESNLDSYKLPSIFKKVDYLPYTKNGKVDKGVLMVQNASLSATKKKYDISETILDFVRELTGIKDATYEDNFIALGGDSLSVLALVENIRQLGWKNIGIRDVLQSKNIQSLVEGLSPKKGKIQCVE